MIKTFITAEQWLANQPRHKLWFLKAVRFNKDLRALHLDLVHYMGDSINHANMIDADCFVIAKSAPLLIRDYQPLFVVRTDKNLEKLIQAISQDNNKERVIFNTHEEDRKIKKKMLRQVQHWGNQFDELKIWHCHERVASFEPIEPVEHF